MQFRHRHLFILANAILTVWPALLGLSFATGVGVGIVWMMLWSEFFIYLRDRRDARLEDDRDAL